MIAGPGRTIMATPMNVIVPPMTAIAIRLARRLLGEPWPFAYTSQPRLGALEAATFVVASGAGVTTGGAEPIFMMKSPCR